MSQRAARLREHRDVVRVPEAAGHDQQAHAGLAERVRQLGRLVGRVDGDEDRADPGGGELRHDPLVAVRRPDPDAVALADPAGEQSSRRGVDLEPQLAVGGPVVLVARRRAPRARRSAPPSGAGSRRSSRRAAGTSLGPWQYEPVIAAQPGWFRRRARPAARPSLSVARTSTRRSSPASDFGRRRASSAVTHLPWWLSLEPDISSTAPVLDRLPRPGRASTTATAFSPR